MLWRWTPRHGAARVLLELQHWRGCLRSLMHTQRTSNVSTTGMSTCTSAVLAAFPARALRPGAALQALASEDNPTKPGEGVKIVVSPESDVSGEKKRGPCCST